MKIRITSSSGCGYKIIDANTIDEGIKILQNDQKLVSSIINKEYSTLENNIPTRFVVDTYSYIGYDAEIEIYDYYRE